MFDARTKISASRRRTQEGSQGRGGLQLFTRHKLNEIVGVRYAARGRGRGAGAPGLTRPSVRDRVGSRTLPNFTVVTQNPDWASDSRDIINQKRAEARNQAITRRRGLPTVEDAASANPFRNAIGDLNSKKEDYVVVEEEQEVEDLSDYEKVQRITAAPSLLVTRRTHDDDEDMLEGVAVGGSYPPPTRGAVSHRLGVGGAKPQKYKVSITNLAESVSDADIQELCATVNGVIDCGLVEVGRAYAVFSARPHAQTIVDKYNGVPLDGVPMRLQLVTANQPAKLANSGTAEQRGRLTKERAKQLKVKLVAPATSTTREPETQQSEKMEMDDDDEYWEDEEFRQQAKAATIKKTASLKRDETETKLLRKRLDEQQKELEQLKRAQQEQLQRRDQSPSTSTCTLLRGTESSKQKAKLPVELDRDLISRAIFSHKHEKDKQEEDVTFTVKI